MKLNIQATIKSIETNPDGTYYIDQEITSVRRDIVEELKELVLIPDHWTIPIKRNRKEPLSKEELEWRHMQAKDKSPRKEKKKPKKKQK